MRMSPLVMFHTLKSGPNKALRFKRSDFLGSLFRVLKSNRDDSLQYSPSS